MLGRTRLAAVLQAEAAKPQPWGPFNARPADPRRRPARRRAPLPPRSRMDHTAAVDDGHAADVRRVRGQDGVRRTIGDPVSRHERRLAGKRSRAGRHHDRVRRDDVRRAGRRQRRVRRRDAAGVPPAADRGAFSRRPPARVGRHLGTRDRRSRHRRRLRVDHERARRPARPAHRDRRPLRARLSAQGRRRGDQRADQGDALAAGRSPPRLRARRLAARRRDVRRVPPVRQIPAPVRLRPSPDRPWVGLARGIRDRDHVAAVRGRGRPARRRSRRRSPRAR